jgi:hypothetical protein
MIGVAPSHRDRFRQRKAGFATYLFVLPSTISQLRLAMLRHVSKFSRSLQTYTVLQAGVSQVEGLNEAAVGFARCEAETAATLRLENSFL